MKQLRVLDRHGELVAGAVRRCGSAAHLVPDTLLETLAMLDHHPMAEQANFACEAAYIAARWVLLEQLMRALLEVEDVSGVEGRCSCQPPHAPCKMIRWPFVEEKVRPGPSTQPLTVLSVNRYGGVADGLYTVKNGDGTRTDHDVMLEFGPVHWTAGVVEETEPAPIDPAQRPLVWARPTDTPGFVTLQWARTTECEHSEPLEAMLPNAFGHMIEDFRQLRFNYYQLWTPSPSFVRRWPDDPDADIYDVPCLRMPWWPARKEFLGRRRKTEFPPAAVRKDMCLFGVHLVPGGDSKSDPLYTGWQVSFARAMVVAIRHLSPVQHATASATKTMEMMLRKSGAGKASLKGDYVTTAVFWLVQDTPSDRWPGVSEGVRMVLEWLEERVRSSHLPCFFFPEMNLMADLSQTEIANVLETVQLLKNHSAVLLMACCDKTSDLNMVLGDGAEPLKEHQLRRCLARHLICDAVLRSVSVRHKAPCWQPWFKHKAQGLRFDWVLLHWSYRCASSKYALQCGLLGAWRVLDPADLKTGPREVPQHECFISVDVTPLMAVLTESDFRRMVGDGGQVAEWCRRKLRLPASERPVGLPDGLDTPHARAQLLLQPELMRTVAGRALNEQAEWEKKDQRLLKRWTNMYHPLPDYQRNYREMLRFAGRTYEYWVETYRPLRSEELKQKIIRQWRQEVFDALRRERGSPETPYYEGYRLYQLYQRMRWKDKDSWEIRPLLFREHFPDGESSFLLVWRIALVTVLDSCGSVFFLSKGLPDLLKNLRITSLLFSGKLAND